MRFIKYVLMGGWNSLNMTSCWWRILYAHLKLNYLWLSMNWTYAVCSTTEYYPYKDHSYILYAILVHGRSFKPSLGKSFIYNLDRSCIHYLGRLCDQYRPYFTKPFLVPNLSWVDPGTPCQVLKSITTNEPMASRRKAATTVLLFWGSESLGRSRGSKSCGADNIIIGNDRIRNTQGTLTNL